MKIKRKLHFSGQDGTEGILDTLVTLYADKFYTYEEEVRTALRSLRERQAVKQLPVDETPSQVFITFLFTSLS